MNKMNEKIRLYVKEIGSEYRKLLRLCDDNIDNQETQIKNCLNEIDSLTREIKIILER